MTSRLYHYVIITFLTIIILPATLHASAKYISYEEFNSFYEDIRIKRKVLEKNLLDAIKDELSKQIPNIKDNVINDFFIADTMRSNTQKGTLLIIGDLPIDIWKRIGDTNSKIDSVLNSVCKDLHNYFGLHNLDQRFISSFLSYQKKEKIFFHSLSAYSNLEIIVNCSLNQSKIEDYIRILAQQIPLITITSADTVGDKSKIYDDTKKRANNIRVYKKRDKLLMSALWYIRSTIPRNLLIELLGYGRACVHYLNAPDCDLNSTYYDAINTVEHRIRMDYMDISRHNSSLFAMNALQCQKFQPSINPDHIPYSFAYATFLNDWNHIQYLCSDKSLLSQYSFGNDHPCVLYNDLIEIAIVENSKKAFLVLIKENPFQKCDVFCIHRTKQNESCLSFFFQHDWHRVRERVGEKRWKKYYNLFQLSRVKNNSN